MFVATTALFTHRKSEENMETLTVQKKFKKELTLICGVLIGVSTLALLGFLFISQGYTGKITMQMISGKSHPSIGIDYTLYFVQDVIELLLSVIVLVSATFVLKYRDIWRRMLLYTLITSIIFLLVFPIINYYMLALKIASNGGIKKNDERC